MWMLRSAVVSVALVAALAGADLPPTGKPIKLFNGKNLKGFDTFLKEKGLNNDPDKVFQVHDGMVHASGKEYGYFITQQEYDNYHLRAEFKWGNQTHPPRQDKARDSGILYHVVGPNMVWPKSIEFQMIEGGTGDIILVGGASLTVKGVTREKGRFDRFGKGPWKDVAGYRDPQARRRSPTGSGTSSSCSPTATRCGTGSTASWSTREPAPIPPAEKSSSSPRGRSSSSETWN